jgi:hypothetical protein
MQNLATQNIFHWDPISGSSQTTFTQMMKISNMKNSHSDRRPAKFRPNKEALKQREKLQKPKGTGASSSGMSPEERARSLLLPTTDEAEGSVLRERSEEQDPGGDGQGDDDSVPSAIEYLENPQLIL